MATSALWNTFSNPASGPSLFQRIGAAGYGTASGGGSSESASSPANMGRLDGAIDASRSQAASAVSTARQYGQQAIGAGQSGVDAIQAGRPYVDQAYADMRGAADAAGIGYDAAYEAARGMDPYIRGLADEAGNVRGVADRLSPLADTLGGYGNSMWESGTKVTEQALATLGTGLGFINLDAGASPLVAEAIRIYGEIDQDRYVAAAAQDMQTQGENVRAQNERNLARRGVSPTSGAAQALSQQYDRALAVARAAAMTRARERGLNDKAAALQSLIANNANTFLQTGGQLASIGASAQGQAVGAQKGAADVLGTQGGLYGKAGDILGNAGQLQGSQGSLLASIAGGRGNLAGIYGNAANLVTGYDKDLHGAYSALAGITNDVGRNVTGAQNSLASAFNALGSTTLNAGNSITGAQERQAANTLSGEQLRVSAVNGDRGRRVNSGVNVIDNTNNAIAARIAAGAKDPIARF